jgi:hypothetical protein
MTNSSNQVGSGCLILFGIPFAGGGFFFLVVALRSLQNPDPKFQNPLIGAFMGATFAVIGLLIMAAGFGVIKGSKRLQATQAAYPDQPWMWRKDWAQGRAQGQTAGSAMATWVFTLLWNGISFLPVYFFFTRGLSEKKPIVLFFVAIFPLIGIFLLFLAIKQTMRLARYGRTSLQLQTLPAPLGRNLKGTIDARLPYPLPHGINLALSCVNRVTTGSGDSQSTSDHIFWQEKKTLGSEQIMAGPAGSTIPVEFEIPRNQPSTNTQNVSNEILWLLRAEADIPGVNFDETYQVPVFETRDSPNLQDWQSHEAIEERAHPPTAPVRPTVIVSSAPEGGTQFYFPAGRNLSAAFGVTFFAAIFSATTYAILHLHAPLLFAIVFGLFSLLTWLIALKLWFGTARIVANSNGVSLHSSTLGLGGSKQWASSQIRDIYPKITMQSGAVPYYTATLVDTSLRSFSMGNALRDHNEAEWICTQVRQAANVQPTSAANK